MSVSVVDLLGAGFMGGTLTDDIMTTGAGGAAAGAVLTTTEAVDLTGSKDKQRRNIHKKKGLMLQTNKTAIMCLFRSKVHRFKITKCNLTYSTHLVRHRQRDGE